MADLDAPDFRDPNVFWYEPQHKWVMVAVLADERQLVILTRLTSSTGPSAPHSARQEIRRDNGSVPILFNFQSRAQAKKVGADH